MQVKSFLNEIIDDICSNNEKNDSKPICIIVAGPNGAGKSTFINSLKSDFEYLNYDQIVKDLNTNVLSLKAGRFLVIKFRNLIERRISFIYETVLADKTKFLENAISEMKGKNYCIFLVYTWLSSVDLCKKRIRDRVESGGHFVKDEIVETRYNRSLENYIHRYLFLSDYSLCFNNDEEPELVFSFRDNTIEVCDYSYWRKLLIT